MPFPPKKKKADLALLIPELEGEEPEASDDMPEEEDDLGTEEDMGEMEEEDPLAAEGEDPFADEAPTIDPEQAALAETLGFTEPDQQQALIDLIKLVTSSDMGSTETGSSLPPLPESPY